MGKGQLQVLKGHAPNHFFSAEKQKVVKIAFKYVVPLPACITLLWTELLTSLLSLLCKPCFRIVLRAIINHCYLFQCEALVGNYLSFSLSIFFIYFNKTVLIVLLFRFINSLSNILCSVLFLLYSTQQHDYSSAFYLVSDTNLHSSSCTGCIDCIVPHNVHYKYSLHLCYNVVK